MSHSSRRGAAVVVILIALALAAIVAGIVLWQYLGSSGTKGSEQPILTTVSLGPYENIVVEEGEVESSNNVEVRSEVKAKGSAGTNILWVIENATIVKKGDLLVELDSSALEEELTQQQIICNSALALKIQAENVYQAAQIARTEYLEGTFEQEQQAIQSEIFIAEENLRRARQYAQYSERLAAKGYVTALQLEGDRFAVEKAQNELDLAKSKLQVLERYTKAKMLKTFEADIAIAEAKLESETESYEVELAKLEQLKSQIEKCNIYSPADGQVVHANEYSSRGNSEFVVEPGATVREGQTIIRIPDPSSMQVKAAINEARITAVDAGMPVTIHIDALGGRTLEGEVMHVNEYAEPTSWFMSSVKKYGTMIRINNPPPTLRPGLTAQVRIFVERRPSALQVPVQAVYASGRDAYTLVRTGDGYETRKIEIGSSNDKVVLIESGLEEGDQVVMNPRTHVDLFDLPDSVVEEGLTNFASFDGGSGGPPQEGQRGGGPEDRAGPPGRPNGFAGAPDGPGAGGGRGSDGDFQGEPRGGPPGGGGFNPAEIVSQRFAALDTDGDGRIVLSEVPAAQREMVGRADADNDGEITRGEMLQALQAVRERMQGDRPVGAQ